MKIVALGGSLRSRSFTYLVLQLALRKVEEWGIQGELIDLRQFHLPFCSGEAFYPNYPDVEILRQSIQSATTILLATPEYHGNMSGVLKNALDLLENEHMTGKIVGLIAVVGGFHSTNALNALRLVCRQLHSWVIPEQIVIPFAEESFNEKGELKDKELDKRLDYFLERLVKVTHQLGQA